MVVWLKIAHIAALTVWCGGLIALPSLFVRRPAHADGPELWRLQRFARAAFIQLVSPAAYVAIGTGIALVFVREVFDVWFALKLFGVGLLVILHLWAGHVVAGVFRPGRTYSRSKRLAAELTTASVVVAILWLVLAKPDLEPSDLPDVMRTPGGLQSLSERLRPMP